MEPPKVYLKFKAKDRESDEIVEYRIQDAPESSFDAIVAMFERSFLPFEEVCESRRFLDSPEAVAEFSAFVSVILRRGRSIACFKNDGSEELVAANLLVICSKDDPKNDHAFQTSCMKDLLAIVDYIKQFTNIFEKFNTDSYLAGYGLVVDRNYQKRGIATEMLRARVPILKSLSMTLTVTKFSAQGSQNAARNADYEDVFAIKYQELSKAKEQFGFLSAVKTENYKVMSLKIS